MLGILSLVLATVSVSFADSLALEEHRVGVHTYNATAPCRFESVWPSTKSIVLIAAESVAVEVILKLWGNCSEFLRPVSPSRSHLKIAFFGHDLSWNKEDEGHDFSFELLTVIPLAAYRNISSAAIASSPLLFQTSQALDSGDFSQLPWDISGNHNHEKEFSLWGLQLQYMKGMLNPSTGPTNVTDNVDFFDIPRYSYKFEFHLLSNLSTPVNTAISWPAIELRLTSYFEKPSSYFYPIAPRYNTLHGFVCLSACGKTCTRHSKSLPHSLRPTHSPVCTPISQVVDFNLPGPSFTLTPVNDADGFRYSAMNSHLYKDGGSRTPHEVAFVCIGGVADARGRDISVAGSGRHRLLSLIAAVLSDSVGFIFLKTARTHVDHARVLNIIRKFDLVSSYPFIAFRHRQFKVLEEMASNGDASDFIFPFPSASFGSIHEGILISKAAALMMLNAAMDELLLQHKETLPAACSEFLIFSDAWLCWCAASLDISALDIALGSDLSQGMDERRNCTATSSLYSHLEQLYEQQRLSNSAHSFPKFADRTTLGFRMFMQTLLFHLVSSPRILHIPDNEESGDSLFVDACSGQLLVEHMFLTGTPPVVTGLHPLLQRLSEKLVSAPNRSAFISVMRSGIISGFAHGHDGVNSSMSDVRRLMRMGISAMRVLGCSVKNTRINTGNVTGYTNNHFDDLLFGHKQSSGENIDALHMHLITPAVLLSRLSQPVSRAFFLATHSEWTNVFGYNPVFSKDASLAYGAPDFGVHDWEYFCMLAVTSMKSRFTASFDTHSREYMACSAFASAVSQRTYDAGMPRCFDLPPHVAGGVRYMGSVQTFTRYLRQCQGAVSEDVLNDDPWMLRPLARAVQALLLERWNLQQSWYQSSLHLHSKLIMRADEFGETLQWNICRGNVASITAVVEHGIPVEKYFWFSDVLIHDPHHKLHLESIPGIYQYDTGFKIANDRFSGKVVMMIAADMLLGDEQRWQRLTANGTAAFFKGEKPRFVVLSRLEPDSTVVPCCSVNGTETCNDAFMFVPPLSAGVRLDLFDFQQNVWQSENYATGLLRHGGYEVYNPCLMLPLFHNHLSDERPNQNENSILNIRSEPDVSMCSRCLPQASIEEQCEETRNMKWYPGVTGCYVNNSKIPKVDQLL